MINKLFPQQGMRASAALLVVRVFVGAQLVGHGWGKIQNPFHWMDKADSPAPAVFQLLAAFSEFAGGAALVLGLLTPLAALGIACTMAVAVATHLSSGKGSWELAGAYFCAAVAVLLAGPGNLSLDALWVDKRGR